MLNATKHSQASLAPSEVVTIALLFTLKGRGNRAFYRCLENNWVHFFPNLPHRTRLFRLFNSHHHWIDCFMAAPSLIGLIDSYGIELIHPRRQGRSAKQIGKKGPPNRRCVKSVPLVSMDPQNAPVDSKAMYGSTASLFGWVIDCKL